MTLELDSIFTAWRNNNFKFDSFLLGYLGKKDIMGGCEYLFDNFANENAPIIIDPAFGDNGKLYGGFDKEYVLAMRKLISRADIILPNITEVCYLLGWDYREEYTEAYLKSALFELSRYTKATIIVTGIKQGKNKIGEVIYKDGTFEYVMGKKLPISYHGTGDIFSAVFASHYLNGKPLPECCRLAGEFVVKCIKATKDDHPYGVRFESVLKEEIKKDE